MDWKRTAVVVGTVAAAGTGAVAAALEVDGSIVTGGASIVSGAATIGDGVEFRGEVFRSTIFGVNAADAFIDVDADGRGATFGIERTAGSGGVNTSNPVAFTLSGAALAGVASVEVTSNGFSDLRPAVSEFSGGTLSVMLENGFTVGSDAASDSIRFAFTPVPEPATAGLLAAASVVLLRRR